jgi:hypothetical protein
MHRSPAGTHAAPLGEATLLQLSVVSSQVMSRQSIAGSPQSLGGPPTQVPEEQVSSVVQNCPSSHGMPSSDDTISHWPVMALHAAIWQSGAAMVEQSIPQAEGLPPLPPLPPGPLVVVLPPPVDEDVSSSVLSGVAEQPSARAKARTDATMTVASVREGRCRLMKLLFR